MRQQGNRADRRDFGRRASVIHAWAFPSGRARVPCIIRNISTSGALLEFAYGSPKADSFRLVVPSLRQEWICDVRHRRPHSLGVYFDFMGKIIKARAHQKTSSAFRELAYTGRKIHGMPTRA